MKLKIIVLGLIILSSALALCTTSNYAAPIMNPLPKYSPNSFVVSWNWESGDACSLVDGSCPCNCCFWYYDIREEGTSSSYFQPHDITTKEWERRNKADGVYYYKAKVAFWPNGLLYHTEWSNEVNTTIDTLPPSVSVFSEKTSYVLGERIKIWAYSTDQGSGVNRTYLYLDGQLVNYTNGGYVIYSSATLGVGPHTYFANSTDNVGFIGRSADGIFAVTEPPSDVSTPPSDLIAPQISVNSIKSSYSNNETVYLKVVANDTVGLDMTRVFLGDTVKCTNSTAGKSHVFTCTMGPFTSVTNGETKSFSYNAAANDTSGNLNATIPKTFYVIGNSTCTLLDTTLYNLQCGNNGTQSFLCQCTQTQCMLYENCLECSCPSSYLCNTTTKKCYLPMGTETCSDGTPYDTCSATKPKYCDNGILVDLCSECLCSNDKICIGNSCVDPSSQCGNSVCESDEEETCCRDCGCPKGQQCNTTTDACYALENQAGYIELALLSPKEFTFSPGQKISLILKVLDENNRSVDDAVVILYAHDQSHSSSNMGNGLYEIRYDIAPSAFESFFVSIMAKREDQLSQALPLTLDISRYLEIDFLNIEQNENISESQIVEAKITYPDGSPVLNGHFAMRLGTKLFPLRLEGEIYRGFLNLSGEADGRKNIVFIGEDDNSNTLNAMLVVDYFERKDYSQIIMAVIITGILGGSAYLFYNYRKVIYTDYRTLIKEKKYLITMDKRAHLEFFKRHIDENTFKKLALEYQQKLKDIEKVMEQMRLKHKFLEKITDEA